MTKTCGICGRDETDIMTRYRKCRDNVRDHAGTPILNIRDESAAYLRAYRMEQARAEALEQVALDMLNNLCGIAATVSIDVKALDAGVMAEGRRRYAARLRTLGVEVGQ